MHDRAARRFDALPLLALLLFWAVAGLGAALTVAAAERDPRHLVLGVVTLPTLIVVAVALRRCTRRRPGATSMP